MTVLLQTSCCRCFCVTLTRLPATDKQLPVLRYECSLTTITRYRQPRPLLPSPTRFCFPRHFVCLFVCKQGYTKTTHLMFGGKLAHGPRKKPVDVGGDSDLDPAIVWRNLYHCDVIVAHRGFAGSYRSWSVVEMQIAGVTKFSMISPNDYQTVKDFGHIRYLVEFVNLCVRYKMTE